MKVKLAVSFLLLGLTAISATNAVAGWQTLPGSACKPVFGNQTGNYSVPNSAEAGTLVAAVTGWVTCPIQRTSTMGTTMHAYVNHPTSRTTTCYTERHNSLSGVTTYTAGSSTGTSNRDIVLTPTISTTSAYDTYSISCNLNAGTKVRGTSWFAN